jgi:CRISPR-associated protein Cas2
MLAIITYDVVSNRRRARLHRALKEFGLNTQKSVFECDIDDQTLARVLAVSRETLDFAEDDLRIYRICGSCQRKVAVSGQGLALIPYDFKVI